MIHAISLCMLFESLRHYDFDTFSHEMQTSQDPNFIFDTQLYIPHETLHIHTQQISIYIYSFTSYAKLFHGVCTPSASKVFNK